MKRQITVLVVILFALSAIPFRLIALCLGDKKEVSFSTSSKMLELASARGDIYDCKMRKLVNIKEETIIAVKPCTSSADVLKSKLTLCKYNELLDSIRKASPFITSLSNTDIVPDEYIKTALKYNRYSDDSLACHIIGYINSSDNIGMSGIEKSFDSLLTDENRMLSLRYSSNTVNAVLAGDSMEIVSHNYYSKKGIKLTVDKSIERIAENALKNNGVDKGAAIVLEANTGKIRALASSPSFNQNELEKYLNDESSPFINRALCAYSVGSVFKLVVAAAAIKNGYDDLKSECTGSASISGITFSCSGKKAHGSVDLKKAFSVSCNTYFLRLALKIGKEKLLKTASDLGFGREEKLTDYIVSVSGTLPEISDISTDGDLANLSFGQGELLATPLQIAECYAAAVNGGKRISASLVESLVDSDGNETEKLNSSPFVYRAFDNTVSEKLREMLMNNFKVGNCVSAKPKYAIGGGKTSTAETGRFDSDKNKILNSWFAGFVETKNNCYIIVAFRENGQSGARDCGPVFKEIADRLWIYD